jgi:hypothetical protein
MKRGQNTAARKLLLTAASPLDSQLQEFLEQEFAL